MSGGTDWLGPVEFLVVEFAGGKVTSGGFEALSAAVDGNQLVVLDLEFVAKSETGELSLVEVDDLDADLGFLSGASAHLIDGDDIEDAGALIAAGSIAAIIVYEVLSVLPVIAAFEASGATLAAAGGIEFDDLDAAITAAETKDS
jgi:hypothetical protein